MNTPKNFIGIDTLQQVANQVFKSVVMGPQYAAPEDMQRLGVKVISGIQYQRTTNIFLRKGGTTRRKDAQAFRFLRHSPVHFRFRKALGGVGFDVVCSGCLQGR